MARNDPIVAKAIRLLDCPDCGATKLIPCVSRTGKTYAYWFVHTGRRQPFDEEYERGWVDGHAT